MICCHVFPIAKLITSSNYIKQKFRGLRLCLYDAAARNYTTINTTKLIRRYHEIQRKYFDTYTTQSQDTTTML